MRKTVVFVPELGRSFASISAAAIATGADPSNIGKVLRGRRRSAKGFTFEYRWAKEEGRSEALAELRDALKQANQLIQTAKKRKQFGFMAEFQELDKLRDVIGSNQRGYIKTASKDFVTYSVPEIERITRVVKKRLSNAQKAKEKADETVRDFADMLGLSFAEALEYEPMVPEFYRMLELADKDQRVGTNEMLEIEIKITNAGADAGQVAILFGKLYNFFADPSLPREYFDNAVNKAIEDIRGNDDYEGYFEYEDEDTWY